jgi:hypothetical protein
VLWVDSSAEINAGCPGSKEGSIAVLGQGPETEPARVDGESGLLPLFIVRVKAGELLEASADSRIEGS